MTSVSYGIAHAPMAVPPVSVDTAPVGLYMRSCQGATSRGTKRVAQLALSLDRLAQPADRPVAVPPPAEPVPAPGTRALINGRRVVASGIGADSSVDVNAIAVAMIERSEVLKDGASTIYGSDAIGGVANLITRTDVNGTEVALYPGGAQPGDGEACNASLVTGLGSPAGSVMFSAAYQAPPFAGERGCFSFDKNCDFKNHVQSSGGTSSTPGGRLDS